MIRWIVPDYHDPEANSTVIPNATTVFNRRSRMVESPEHLQLADSSTSSLLRQQTSRESGDILSLGRFLFTLQAHRSALFK